MVPWSKNKPQYIGLAIGMAVLTLTFLVFAGPIYALVFLIGSPLVGGAWAGVHARRVSAPASSSSEALTDRIPPLLRDRGALTPHRIAVELDAKPNAVERALRRSPRLVTNGRLWDVER